MASSGAILKDLFVDQREANQWSILDGSLQDQDTTIDADVVIIGSGAGGGVAAEIFSRAGRKVVLVEEGALHTSRDFDLYEAKAYRSLYCENLTRTTSDGAIAILQARTVGGTTVVNWTASFRTPVQTLDYWKENFGVSGLDETTLAPWFQQMETKLNIGVWDVHNRNNALIAEGCKQLGIPTKLIPRNVKGCWNLGYCGVGCPTNAKQSMLVTTIPAALNAKAVLIHRVKIEKLLRAGDRIVAAEGLCLDQNMRRRNQKLTLRAPLFVASAGAIGTPMLFLKSDLPDPYDVCGRRTFLHPTVFAFGIKDTPVEPYYGAPQSIYSDYFQWPQGVDGPVGYKIEATPLHPMFASLVIAGVGDTQRSRLTQLSHTAGAIALLRDGFHEQCLGGRVQVDNHQSGRLDYPMTDYLWDGARRAHLSLAEIYFAAGCKAVHLGHASTKVYRSWSEAQRAIRELTYGPARLRVGSAHVMGGSTMGANPQNSVINSRGRHHHLQNLYVMDGSIFPTSVGANPQLSIYAIVAKLAHDIVGDGNI